MAVRKINGHAVTGVIPKNADSAQVVAAQPKFIRTQGPADNGGINGKKSTGGTPYKK